MGLVADSPQGQEVKILVVDDEPTIRSLVKELLAAAGYDALFAPDGALALDLVHKLRPDLIVLDLVMPWMSGIEVIQEIRQDSRLKDIPILIISGCITESEANHLLGDLKVAGYVNKIELPTTLISRVRKILSTETDQAA